MFVDIHQEIHIEEDRIFGATFDELFYADDTICIAQTTAAMNRMLHANEIQGKTYGLNLNKAKCEYPAFGVGTGNITFSGGTKIKVIIYLASLYILYPDFK